YDRGFNLPVAFPNESPSRILGELLAEARLRQLRIAETEKYAHVTVFFNGGRETVFEREDRILVPSPKVATYDLQPEMSAPEVTAAHGNPDQTWDYATNSPHTAPTTNPVRCILACDALSGRSLRGGGVLADVAPTLIECLETQQPEEITRKSLLS